MSALDSEPLDLLQRHQEQAQTNHRTCMTMHDLNFTAHKQRITPALCTFGQVSASRKSENFGVILSQLYICPTFRFARESLEAHLRASNLGQFE